MSRTFDFVLAGASLIIGILLLTGHGDFFMKGGNTQMRKAKFDEEKMAKASGLALVLIGIVTFIDSYTTSAAAKIGYIVVVAAIFVGLVWYLQTKCLKKK